MKPPFETPISNSSDRTVFEIAPADEKKRVETREDPPAVPESEMEITFAHSSGPGGQNVNKTTTKAWLKWNVGKSAVFSEERKAAIRQAAGKRLNAADEVVLFDQSQRSQAQNREAVIARLQDLVARALAPQKERKPTKVSRAEKEKRLDEKRRQAQKKLERRLPKGEW